MAIYLDNQTRTYLERLIDKRVEKSDSDFIAKRVQGMLKADRERLEEIADCDHKYGIYKGKKTCCVKCGNMNKSMGFEWTLTDEEVELKEQKDEYHYCPNCEKETRGKVETLLGNMKVFTCFKCDNKTKI